MNQAAALPSPMGQASRATSWICARRKPISSKPVSSNVCGSNAIPASSVTLCSARRTRHSMYISKSPSLLPHGSAAFVLFRCVLVASSDYFEAMISRSGMQEATADTIELKDITANGLRAVLDFIYTGELTLSIENIGEIRTVTQNEKRLSLSLV